MFGIILHYDVSACMILRYILYIMSLCVSVVTLGSVWLGALYSGAHLSTTLTGDKCIRGGPKEWVISAEVKSLMT